MSLLVIVHAADEGIRRRTSCFESRVFSEPSFSYTGQLLNAVLGRYVMHNVLCSTAVGWLTRRHPPLKNPNLGILKGLPWRSLGNPAQPGVISRKICRLNKNQKSLLWMTFFIFPVISFLFGCMRKLVTSQFF